MAEIGPKEELQTWLAEYSAMRSEAVQRISSAYQLTAVVVAGAVLLITHFSNATTEWIVGAVIALFVLWMWVLMMRDARRVTRRIRIAEAEINTLLGRDVLTHERDLNDLWHRWGIL